MILVGQYDSPYVRRVAISLKLAGLQFTRDTVLCSPMPMRCGASTRSAGFRRWCSTTARC